jgi:hypothetical protein
MKTKTSWLAMRLERISKTSREMQQWSAWAVTAALVLAAIPSLAGQATVDGGAPGPFPVGHTSFLTKADNSGRRVAVDVYYPADSSRITTQSGEALYAAFPYQNNSPAMTSSQWEAFGYDRAYESPAAATGPFPLIVFGTALGFPGWGVCVFWYPARQPRLRRRGRRSLPGGHVGRRGGLVVGKGALPPTRYVLGAD